MAAKWIFVSRSSFLLFNGYFVFEAANAFVVAHVWREAAFPTCHYFVRDALYELNAVVCRGACVHSDFLNDVPQMGI